MATTYAQPTTQLLDFIRGQYPNGPFKMFYDGDPDLIPEFNLPCISVTKNSDQMSNGPTGFQQVTEELLVKVIFNAKDDWQNDMTTNALTEKRIRDIVEARDTTTGAYLSNTLKHAIMTRFTAKGVAVSQSMNFELGIVPRPEDTFTREGHLTVTVTYLVQNPAST